MTIDEARTWLQRHADNTPMPGAREAYRTILEALERTRWVPGKRFIATAIHEDGTLFEEDSDWNWNDIWEYGLYDEERDDYIIPDGWWESRCFTPDGYYNCPVDCEVTHWRLLPELTEVE